MNFTKELRSVNLQFEVLKSEETDVLSVKVVIPPRSEYSRGSLFTSDELNNLICEHLKLDLTPLIKNGRYKDFRKKTKSIVLTFNIKTNIKTKKAKNKKSVANTPNNNNLDQSSYTGKKRARAPRKKQTKNILTSGKK